MASWEDNKKLTVINFFGGPGSGKSTCAAEVFAKMKKQGMKVELIHEIAKDFVWEKMGHIFREQDYITAHQHRLQRRLVGHDIDYVVIDSSLLLGLFYLPEDFPPSFRQFVLDVFNSYDNINIYLRRNDEIKYIQEGRNQTEDEALEIDSKVLQFFWDNGIPFFDVRAGDYASTSVLNIALQHEKQV
jgi:hypothetical protein